VLTPSIEVHFPAIIAAISLISFTNLVKQTSSKLCCLIKLRFGIRIHHALRSDLLKANFGKTSWHQRVEIIGKDKEKFRSARKIPPGGKQA
jgi:hypothetical protein